MKFRTLPSFALFLAIPLLLACKSSRPHKKEETLVADYLSTQLHIPPQKLLFREFEGYKWHLPQLESIQARWELADHEGQHCLVAHQTYVWCENDAKNMLKGLILQYNLGNPNSSSAIPWSEWLQILEYGLHIDIYGSDLDLFSLVPIPKEIQTQLHHPRITIEAGPAWKTKIEFNYLAKGPAPHRPVASLHTMEIIINGGFGDVSIHSEFLHTFVY